MKSSQWLERPRTLAVLTLAFALVPVAFALFTFRAARERDAKLFDTAAEVLGEQLNLSTFRHVAFLNVLRNQWRSIADPGNPPRKALPPGGWAERVPHLRAVAYARHDDEQHLPLRWQEGRVPVRRLNDNLADDPALAEGMKRARLTAAPIAIGVRVDRNTMAVVEAVTGVEDNALVRGYLITWLDLASLCQDTTLPLVRNAALHAEALTEGVPTSGQAREFTMGEGEAQWRAAISRGAGFTREYGTPTPWLGFAGFALSALPLSVLVMLAASAGKLRSALEVEREAVRMKTHFLHSVSHEFRTPLSVIQSGAELIEHYENQLPPERRAQALGQIKDSARQMNEMVEQVLMLSRIESHQMRVQAAAVNLHVLCSEIVNAIQTSTNQRCQIELRCDPALEIHSDVTLLRSIVSNLLSNAVKYSPPGKSVMIEVTHSGDALHVIVSDQGTGIPTEDLPRVCEPFHRGGNTGTTPGTGLGLAIAAKSAALLKGSLALSSKVGEGTVVTFCLPVSTPPAA